MLMSTAAAIALAVSTSAAIETIAIEDGGVEGTPTSYVDGAKQVFTKDYFTQYAPQSAQDMLRNVPGFQVRRGEDRRGLGQGGTNILINGSRVSGKSNDPLDVLSRTSAEAVVRIEIVDGATLGISGLSGPVANVIVDQGQHTGNWEWTPQFRKGLATRLYSGSVSMTGKVKGVSYTVGLENNQFRNGAWGNEYVIDPTGTVIEDRYEQVQPSGNNPVLSLSLNHKDDAGREANLSAKGGLFIFDFSEISDRHPYDPNENDYRRIVMSSEDSWFTELSGDYAWDAFGGRTKLIGVHSYENIPIVSTSESSDASGFLGGSIYEEDAKRGESILRTEQTWSLDEKRSLEFAVEGAYNFAESAASYVSVAPDRTETPIALDGSNTKIEERRGEVSIAYNFPIGEKLDIQTSIAMEYSELEQTGELANKRSFTRPKGFVSATYKLAPKLELRGRFERRVGQLDFGAFSSSVNLNNDNQSLGNNQLVPDQTWFLQGAIEKTFDDDSKLTLTVDYEKIEDIVQLIPIGTGDGFGNVEEADRYRVEFLGTQKLAKWGIPGGQLDWDFTVRDSEIIDPFTGEQRRLDRDMIYYARIEYRQDIPNSNYAYGFSGEHFENSQVWRRSEVSRFTQSDPAWEAYIQHKDIFGATATAYVYNIFNYTEDFYRDIYDGPRATSPLLYRETKDQTFNPIFGINFEGTF